MEERLLQTLEPHALIGLDTCVFVYHLESHPRYSELTIPLFQWIERGRTSPVGQLHAVTSVLSLMEINVRPLALGKEDIADEYETLLSRFPNLSILDIDRRIARQAAELRARYRLHPPDALQIATAIRAGASAFVTNDVGLSKISAGIAIIILDRILQPG